MLSISVLQDELGGDPLSIDALGRFPWSLRNVEDLPYERGIDVSHETIRYWRNRFVPLFTSEIMKRRADRLKSRSNWQWYLDEVFVKMNGVWHHMRRAVDQESDVLEAMS